MNISIVMIVKNGAKTIKKSLDSLKEFSDVVVYDNGSDDDTISIVKEYKNVNLIEGEFKGFGPTKNKAATYAKNEWILILDSDEVIDKKLLETLKKDDFDKNYVYLLNFKAYYKNYQVKYCGWNNQKIKRFYNKSVTCYNDNLVHEDIITKNMKVKELKGNIDHYSYSSISDFIVKIDRYSTLYANENISKKSSPLKAVSSSMFAFFKTYIIRRGFLDGFVGLIIAYSRASVVFYKYIKLYERNLDEK